MSGQRREGVSLWKCDRCGWRTAAYTKPGRCMSNGHGMDMARPLLNECDWTGTPLKREGRRK